MPADTVRPELEALSTAQRRRVLARIGSACHACGNREFEVGHALALGFLFVTGKHGTYRVALTCRNPGCPAPHTSIVLPGTDFLD